VVPALHCRTWQEPVASSYPYSAVPEQQSDDTSSPSVKLEIEALDDTSSPTVKANLEKAGILEVVTVCAAHAHPDVSIWFYRADLYRHNTNVGCQRHRSVVGQAIDDRFVFGQAMNVH
jgi:hypothetical protein